MINIKENTLERISTWLDESIYVVTDFDKTLTDAKSDSSWCILSHSRDLPSTYNEEVKKHYDYYRPIEVDESMDNSIKDKYMVEWWHKHINLFIKYKLNENIVKDASKNIHVMNFRKGAKDFLYSMYKRNIPVIIISAGIGNFIEEFLKINDCLYDNIYILSNFIEFKNNIAVGVGDQVIHALNKNQVSLPNDIKEKIKDRKNIILLGDSVSDIKMIEDNKKNSALKIGFLEEKEEDNEYYFYNSFDIVCTNNTSFEELSEKINILKK